MNTSNTIENANTVKDVSNNILYNIYSLLNQFILDRIARR